MIEEQIKRLPDDFTFGVATSAYQIEGTDFGGCGRSHWDDFAKKPGAVHKNQNGQIACDHYHRWKEDLTLIAQGGFDAYRFSFAWPRLLPETDNRINPDGLSFYDALIDRMLELELKPFATLYHWDLPSRLADKGGWTNRDTALRFADFTEIIMKNYGDRLHSIAPTNEPWCASWLSHFWGHHAPGLKDISATGKAMHYIQLAHGVSIEVMRDFGHKNLGCVLNKEHGVTFDDSVETLRLTELFDGIYNRWFEESIFNGKYPEDVLAILGEHLPKEYENDMEIISQPLDWVGVNYYTRSVITQDKQEKHFGFKCIKGDLPKTDMGWEIDPEGLSFFLRRLTTDYAPGKPIYITENGMANKDQIYDGKVNDVERISYLAKHLNQVALLIEEGVPIEGYFTWSLLDNYEWAFGYDKRFGIVHVDFDSLERTPKLSYYAIQKGLENR